MYVWVYRFFKEIDESGQVIKDHSQVLCGSDPRNHHQGGLTGLLTASFIDF